MKSVKIKVPDYLTKSQREALAKDIIDLIKERTLRGLDVDNNPFAPYAKSYYSSKEFRLAGKSRNQVDLRFTHEMMNALEIAGTSRGEIDIGFINDDAAKKAEWAEASDNGPSRRFLGISNQDLDSLLINYPVPETVLGRLSDSILARILNRNEDS